MIQTFLARRNDDDMDTSRKGETNPSQKEETGRRYGPFSKRRNRSKIWTLFGKEEQVKDMDSPHKGRTYQNYEPSSDKGEQDDDMDPPWKGGVMMRLSLMMGW